MNENEINLVNGTQNYNVDPEQLKITVGIIKKNLLELDKAKKKADDAWENCKATLSENVTKSLEDKKISNDKRFIIAKEQLEEYANTLDSVSNIWKDTENEIISSSQELEETISNINNNIGNAFGLGFVQQINKDESQNNSSNI